MAVKVELKSILAGFDRAVAEYKADNARLFDKIGVEGVEYAKQNGAYQNRTGRLRAANEHKTSVGDNVQLDLINDTEYASYVEAKGYDVLTGAFLDAVDKVKQGM